MNILIWCSRPSESALALRDAFRLRGYKAYKVPSLNKRRNFTDKIKLGDIWINWGSPPKNGNVDFSGLVVFNNMPLLNKKSQLVALSQHNVPTLELSDAPREGFIGRSYRHQEGLDLLNNNGTDYWTKKVDFCRELRIHIFRGLSIHAGLKVPRVEHPHPWIRSYNSGWRIDYSRASDIRGDRRDIAKSAVEALNLDFGAVDIGVIRDSSLPIVIEVNTAPGLDPSGRSIEVYVDAFLREYNRCSRTNNGRSPLI